MAPAAVSGTKPVVVDGEHHPDPNDHYYYPDDHSIVPSSPALSVLSDLFSVYSDSDTPIASSEVASASRSLPPRPVPLPEAATAITPTPFPHLPPLLETVDHTDAFPGPPPPAPPPLPTTTTTHQLSSPRSTRSLSLAQISGPVKRKPLSTTASPAAVRFSKGAAAYADIIADLPRPEQRFARSCSLDSPTLYEFPDQRHLLAAAPVASSLNTVVDWPLTSDASQPSSPITSQFAQPAVPPAGAGDERARNIAGNESPATSRSSRSSRSSHTPSDHRDSRGPETASLATQESVPYELDDLYSIPGSPDSPASLASPEPHADEPPAAVVNTTTKTMSLFARKSPPPHLNLATTNTRDVLPATTSATPIDQSNLNKPLPKSPASSKLSAFFGWGAPSPSPPTTATDYSEKSFSPLPSPESPESPNKAAATSVNGPYARRPVTPPGTNTLSNAVAEQNPLQYCEAYLSTPADSTTSLGQLEEMEDELKAIGVELASSIRREMDLEDLVERLQEQLNNPQAPGKRTSDYFSDSGYSTAKFSDFDQAKEEVSLIQRRAEQEKAQLRLELTNKLQDERSKRRLLDQQIQELSKKASQLDVAQLNNSDASGRVKELETMCEDLSRRLSEERTAKNNFEDLLGALKGELRTASNERDNLRDEVVPQLRARVEGLEAAATESAKLAYDTSKMQQELQTLRSQNAELKQTAPRMSMALSRSASVTGGSFRQSRTQSISRSNTTRSAEPRDVLAERLKDVEAQRDALHSALKSLLERQDLQNRENTKRIRQLEQERDRLLNASPKKAGYEREVSNLREEISVLRRRAEEAIEQKWQVEKGLAGLKMDLDRAEGEIASLRSLLKEKDILIPEALARPGSSHSDYELPVTSASLEHAYQELQAAYLDALERIKTLEESTRVDEKTQLAVERLEQLLSAAVSDRDLARNDSVSYRSQVESLQASERQHLTAESDLAAQLDASAERVGQLAQQVRTQLDANAALRTRLAGTIARGEAEQRISTERIAGMQNRLRTLEEQVVAAQTSAEDRVARHEEELDALKDAHTTQLQRLRDAAGGLRGAAAQRGRTFPPGSPLSPMFAVARKNSAMSATSPRMSTPQLLSAPNTTTSAALALKSRPAIRRSTTEPLDMTAQVDTLKGRVAQLEGALAGADAEMQEVVARMSAAQIEVLRLQEEREEAVRETRKLRRVLEEERERVFEGRFKTLSTNVR
ncbi:hypothetical protein C8A05DRAFT_35626 [Staphylotrichum tortipilum]|uniref:DUF7603 domain-containing protein n=1 Tax=Staphylotrichum tortipilum TaxID=2831512 RepID=A0AAN6MIB8_9PEZI|nr:hypothetical protein C8A05DRAFT_35626 [Staphylotrichum longicolle]